jgi:hypothetical protein
MESWSEKILSKKRNYIVIQVTVIFCTVGSLFYYTLPQMKQLIGSQSYVLEIDKIQPSKQIASKIEPDIDEDLQAPPPLPVPPPSPKPQSHAKVKPGVTKPSPTPPITLSEVIPEPVTGASGSKERERPRYFASIEEQPPILPQPQTSPTTPPQYPQLSALPVPTEKATVRIKTKTGEVIELTEDKLLELLNKNKGDSPVIIVEKDVHKKKIWDTDLPFFERFLNLIFLCSPFFGGFVSVVIWRKNRKLQQLTQEKIERAIESKKDIIL